MITKAMQQPAQMMEETFLSVDLKNKEVYADFLAQTFFYVSHSTRLLALAAGVMPREEERYFRRFIKHISEEASHEVLAEKDLQDLGHQPDEFEQTSETYALWEPQYYKILHVDPMSFLGYILSLEVFASQTLPKLVGELEAYYEGKAVRFLRLHADEDPDHVTKAIEFAESLSESRQKLVVQNAKQTSTLYSAMLKSCGKVSAAMHSGALKPKSSEQPLNI